MESGFSSVCADEACATIGIKLITSASASSKPILFWFS